MDDQNDTKLEVRELIAERLGAARLSKLYSRLDAADSLGVKPLTWCSWERGDRTPAPDVLWRIASTWGIPVADLFPTVAEVGSFAA